MYNRILVPLDGSELSECALTHARDIAKGCKVPEVILITVVDEAPLSFTELWNEPMAEVAKQQEKQVKETRRKAEDYLGRIAAGLKKEGIAVQTVAILSRGIRGAVDGILDCVRDKKVDLIIMSTHGRSGISRWAFGSVTEKVIHDARVPVLTVTPVGCKIS